MKKILFFSLILNIVLTTTVFSEGKPFSEAIEKQAAEKGFIQNVFLNNQSVKLTLVPNTELGKLSATHWTNSELPRLTTEKLFCFDKSKIKDFSINKVSQILRSISTMKGTQYYSNRHKKWETLYHDACLIDNPESKKRIQDQTNGSADGKTFYCMQDDNSFGKCYYELNYSQRENEISVCFNNFEPLKFGPITAAKSNNVKINIVVVEDGINCFVYLLVQAYYPKISILEEKMLDSFNSRVDSIYKWFTEELQK